jgi:WD40 repeat protein
MDTTVALWGAKTGEVLGRLKAGAGGLNGVAFSPDGTMLAACDQAGTVYLWGVSAGQVP